MKFTAIWLLIFLFASCDNGRFDADKRQIMAKDVIRNKIGRFTRGFEITSFREDTLREWPDTIIKKPIRYAIDFMYNDSAGQLQTKTGTVIFTSDGKSVVTSEISDRLNP